MQTPHDPQTLREFLLDLAAELDAQRLQVRRFFLECRRCLQGHPLCGLSRHPCSDERVVHRLEFSSPVLLQLRVGRQVGQADAEIATM